MDIDLTCLHGDIEWLRQKMIDIAAVKGSLVDQEVVQVSQELDLLIADYQRIKLYMGV